MKICSRLYAGNWLSIGVAVGAAFGAAMHDMAVGVGIGAGIGSLLMAITGHPQQCGKKD